MLVYRYTTEEELKNIIQGNKCLLGDYNDEITKWSSHNTHKYKYGHKYLHFFKHKKSIEYLKLFRKNKANKNMFVCSYDIPRSVLRLYKGKGYYDSGTSGYDFFNIALTEYAVDVEEFWCDWLVDVEIDNAKVTVEEIERQ